MRFYWYCAVTFHKDGTKTRYIRDPKTDTLVPVRELALVKEDA